MQIPTEILLHQGLELNTASAPDKAQAVSAGETGSSFADILQNPVIDFSAEYTVGPERPLADARPPSEPEYPLAGTQLPLDPERPLAGTQLPLGPEYHLAGTQLPSEPRDFKGWDLQPAWPAGGAQAIGSGSTGLPQIPVMDFSEESTADPEGPLAGIQLPSQPRKFAGWNLRTGWPAGSAQAIVAEDIGSRSAGLPRVPASELSPKSVAEAARPAAGIPLPAAGNSLPQSDDLAAAADLEAVTTSLRNRSSGEPATALLGPVKNLAAAHMIAARPRRADLSAGAEMSGRNRQSAVRSEHPQIAPETSGKSIPVLPSTGAAQFVPPADVSPRGRPLANPRARVADLAQNIAIPTPAHDEGAGRREDQPATLSPAAVMRLAVSGPRHGSAPQSRAAPIQGFEYAGVTDGYTAIRDESPSNAIARTHDTGAITGDRVIQEMTTLQVPAETRGTNPSLPAAHQPMVTVSLGSANPAPSVSATAPTVAIDTPVLDPAWATLLQDRVLWLAGRNIQGAQIRLNPAELGPLQVQISVEDNSVDIVFTATHAVTREALESAMPRLKDMLADNGMSLADASVSDQEKADARDERDRNELLEFAGTVEESTSAVNELQPDRGAMKEPTGLVDTYI